PILLRRREYHRRGSQRAHRNQRGAKGRCIHAGIRSTSKNWRNATPAPPAETWRILLMSQISLVAASAQDLEPIALLHAQSWRSTYRGIVPDEFLDQLADSDRREFWAARFASAAVDRWLLLQARG